MGIPDAPMTEESVRVSPNAGLSASATPSAMGANVGDSLMHFGEIENRLWHDANASAVMRASNEVDTHANDGLYNRKNGLVYQNLGENAPPAVDKAASEYTAKVSEIRGRLTNEAQRRMFDASMAEHSVQFKRTLSDYEHKQVTAGQNAQTQAYIANRQTDIAQNYDKPEIVAVNIAQQKYAIVQAYARNTGGDPVSLQETVNNGKAPEALKEILSRNTSAAHMTALNAMFGNGQNGMGKAYFDAHKEEFDAKDLDSATRMVRTGTDDDKARDTADAILGKLHAEAIDETGTEDKSKESLESALSVLESAGIKDTRVYDQAKTRLVNHFNLMRGAHREQQADLLNQGMDAIDAPDNANFDVPANIRAQLDFQGAKALDSYQAKLRRVGRIETDDDTRLMLTTMASEPSQWDAFAELDPNQFKDRLNRVDFRKLQVSYANVKKQIETRDVKLSQGMVSANVAKALFLENGLELPKPPKPGQPASDAYKAAASRQVEFLTQLSHAVQGDALIKKRELTEEEIRIHASRLFATQTWVIPSTSVYAKRAEALWGQKTGSAPTFEAPGAKDRAYSLKDVPEAEVKRLTAAAHAAGIKATEQMIVDRYNENLVSKAARGP